MIINSGDIPVFLFDSLHVSENKRVFSYDILHMLMV